MSTPLELSSAEQQAYKTITTADELYQSELWMFSLRSTRLEIEHREVSTERTIVIYQRTIFNFAVLTGQLDIAQTVAVEVFDISPDLDANTDPVSLIEHLISELATAASVDWERQG